MSSNIRRFGTALIGCAFAVGVGHPAHRAGNREAHSNAGRGWIFRPVSRPTGGAVRREQPQQHHRQDRSRRGIRCGLSRDSYSRRAATTEPETRRCSAVPAAWRWSEESLRERYQQFDHSPDHRSSGDGHDRCGNGKYRRHRRRQRRCRAFQSAHPDCRDPNGSRIFLTDSDNSAIQDDSVADSMVKTIAGQARTDGQG